MVRREQWCDDVTPAAWIAPLLHPFGQDVGSVIPIGFHAYARLFHPVRTNEGAMERWSQVAKRNQRIVHTEMQFHMISRPAGEGGSDGYHPAGDYDGPGPEWGSLPHTEREALTAVLRPATATPNQCWFAVWEGRGREQRANLDLPVARIELPQRRYLLFRGPLDDVVTPLGGEPWDQSPNLWWPEDHAWFVSTEVDYAWTYIGGDATTIASVVADPRLEAMAAQPDDKPFYDSDSLNAALDWEPDSSA